MLSAIVKSQFHCGAGACTCPPTFSTRPSDSGSPYPWGGYSPGSIPGGLTNRKRWAGEGCMPTPHRASLWCVGRPGSLPAGAHASPVNRGESAQAGIPGGPTDYNFQFLRTCIALFQQQCVPASRRQNFYSVKDQAFAASDSFSKTESFRLGIRNGNREQQAPTEAGANIYFFLFRSERLKKAVASLALREWPFAISSKPFVCASRTFSGIPVSSEMDLSKRLCVFSLIGRQ